MSTNPVINGETVANESGEAASSSNVEMEANRETTPSIGKCMFFFLPKNLRLFIIKF